MAEKAQYGKILNSQVFDTQAKAMFWAQKKKTEYSAGGITVKIDVNPVDTTRRRWRAEVFQKV